MTDWAAWPPGDGEMARRMREHDWAATPLGPIGSWPQSLRTAVDMILAMPGPATVLWGPAHVQVYNDAYVPIAKDRHPALLGRSVMEGWPDAYESVIEPLLDAVHAGRATRLVEYPVTLRGAGGRSEERVFDTDWSPIREESGEIGGALQTLVESTGRVRAEAALRESEARHRLLVDSWAQAVWETDAAGSVDDDSPSWRAYTGQTLEESLGYGWLDAIHPEDRAYAEWQWREANAAKILVNAEFRLCSPDGGWRWTNVRAAPVLDEAGRVKKWLGMNVDIDARKRAEVALRRSEGRQAFLLQLSDALRPLAEPAEIARQATRLLGEHLQADRCFLTLVDDDGERLYVREEHLRAGASSVLGDYDFSQFGDFVGPALHAGRILAVADVAALPDLAPAERASYAAVEIAAYLLVPLVRNGRLAAYLTINHRIPRTWSDADKFMARQTADRLWDAIERARAESALRESEARYRSLFEAIDEGFCVIEMLFDASGAPSDYRFLEINPAFERQTGLADATGRRMRELAPKHEQFWFDTYGEIAATGCPARFEHRADALGRWYDVYAFRVGTPAQRRVAILFRDILARKQAEAALRESEERQAFLLKLGDALRGETDERQVEQVVLDMLANQLSVDRAYITTSDYGKGETEVPVEVRRGELPPLVGIFRHADFPESAQQVNEGTLVVEDVETDASLSELNRRSFAAVRIKALIGVGLRKGGRDIFWTLAVAASEARKWSPNDVLLMEEAAERLMAAIARARAETALRESEERFRTLAESIEDVFYVTDLDRRALEYLSPSYERVWGRPVADLKADLSAFIDTVHPDDLPLVERGKAAQERGEPVALEYRIVQPDGEVRWILDRSFPVGDQRARRSAGVASDITERKRAEDALRESEERFRRFGEASQDILWMRDAGTLGWTYLTPAFETVYGLSREEALEGDNYRNWLDLILPEDRERAAGEVEKVRKGEHVIFEYRIRRPSDGAVRWLRNTDFPISDGAGGIALIGGIGHDVTDLRESERRSRLLLEELQHRVRNIMAMLRSVARRTGETTDTVEDYVQHLDGRLSAMARTQALLTRDVHATVDLKNLILDELTMQAARPDRYAVTGPDVALSPKAAEVLGLAIHELATNAVKYGALQQADGRVDVRWALLQGEGKPQLSLIWSEFGVRMDKGPSRQGFGTELITRRVPYELRGTGTMEFRPTGLVATIEFPLDDLPSILQTDSGRVGRR